MKRNWVMIGIILLFAGISIIPVTAENIGEQSSTRGNWLYVGGSGPGNYTKIQDAINDASDGDTVFVYAGTYIERIDVFKTITLLGESKNSTIIELDQQRTVIFLEGDSSVLSRFSIRNTCPHIDPIIQIWEANNVTISDTIINGMNYHTGITAFNANDIIIHQNSFIECDTGLRISSNYVHSTNNTIIDNCFFGNGTGIETFNSDYSTISDNIISVRQFGIALYGCHHNLIGNNVIFDANHAISIVGYSMNNSLVYNRIENTNSSRPCNSGIKIDSGSVNVLLSNYISNYTFGVFLKDTYSPVITNNTFLHNMVHARFYNTFSSRWNGNFWGRPRVFPKPIFGVKYIEVPIPCFIEFDWHPAQEPYDLPRIVL